MNRVHYFNYIENKLTILSNRIVNRGKLNILDLNIHSEVFFTQLMNLLLEYHLINMNSIKQNIEAIDLIDEKNKIIIQVSATCTTQKINSSLKKINYDKYNGFTFMFIALAGDGRSLRQKSYDSNNIIFEPSEHIHDIVSILNIVLYSTVQKQKELYELIKNEFSEESDIVKIDSSLTDIINILSNEKFEEQNALLEINPYEIIRKIEINDLESVSPFINDYKIYYTKINEKYNEFDMQSSNKSFSILSLIRKQYIILSANDELTSHELFFKIIDNLIDIVKNSKNYVEITYELLDLCISMLVVDAFTRCKIFKNPEGCNHVIT